MMVTQKNTPEEKVGHGRSSYCAPYKGNPVWVHSWEPGDGHSWVAHSSPGYVMNVSHTWLTKTHILAQFPWQALGSWGQDGSVCSGCWHSLQDYDLLLQATMASTLRKCVTLGQVGTPCNKFHYVFLAISSGSSCGTTKHLSLPLSLLWITYYCSCSEKQDEAVGTVSVYMNALCVCLCYLCSWPCVNMHICVLYTHALCAHVCWEHMLSLTSSWTWGRGTAAASPLLGYWINSDYPNWWFLMKSDFFGSPSSVSFCMSKSIFHEPQ